MKKYYYRILKHLIFQSTTSYDLYQRKVFSKDHYVRFRNTFLGKISEKGTQKGKMKNQKVQKSKRCENAKSNNVIIQKM